MSDIQIFNNSEFGAVRWIDVDGKPHAVGVDIARALEYANPSKAVIDHCKGITKLGIPSAGGIQETNIIPEGDIYRLIVKAADQSKNPEIKAKAERFENWIFEEVIPAIRKTGSYSTVQSPTEALLQTVQLLVHQEREIKQIKAAQVEHAQKFDVITHRIDSLDAVNVEGDLRQRLNRMVQKYARQKGVLYNIAWHDFKQAFNMAYHTNLELLIANTEKRTGIKNMTIPQYLAVSGKLADGVRVADKLLNREAS